MLKALELVGFKSFADKTRFEFDHGITAVVGPNGSGKSNVVDAIKWVLGEQSPKSLRGKEMADCIFNGSGSRRSVNMAEVTLTFSNENRLLPLDTPEVHISRRVYRSGEGEYLINHQPARLRDIRDLFAGTGAGSEAYAVIEQGKVDALLQASPKDRREIFEEAAGISRFRAKKVESLRRLERVDQNLVRLADIVSEVENQLKTVRSQASRAKRYQEYSERLQSLRTQASLADYRRLTRELDAALAELAERRQTIDGKTAEADALDARAHEDDARMAELDEAVRSCERRIAENRQQIASAEALMQHERARSVELEEELARGRRQLASLSIRSGDLDHQLHETSAAVRSAEERHRDGAMRLATDEQALKQLKAEIDAARAANDARQGRLREQLRQAARLAGDIRSLESQRTAAAERTERIETRRAALDASRQDLHAQLERLGSQEHELAAAIDEETRQLEAVQHRLAERRERRTSVQEELTRLYGRAAAANERATLIEELEERHEGLGPGVRQILAGARAARAQAEALRHEPATSKEAPGKPAPPNPLLAVRGLVADLLQVNVETAPLVEAALGELASHVAVNSGSELFSLVAAGELPLGGRVGFLPLDVPLPPAPQPWGDAPVSAVHPLEKTPGVIGRADRLVETADDLRPLAKRLLGHVWIVETLPQALRLSQQFARERLDFVTLGGELLRADGSLLAGPRHSTLGLISRKSELRELRRQIAQLAQQTECERAELERIEGQLDSDDLLRQTLTARRQRAIDALSEHKTQLTAVAERRAQLDVQRATSEGELAAARSAEQTAAGAVADARSQLAVVEEAAAEIEREIAAATSEVELRDAARSERASQVTSATVVLAKSEERLEALRTNMHQLERDQEERRQGIHEARTQLASSAARLHAAEMSILRTESQAAELYLDLEAWQRELAEETARRNEQRKARGKWTNAAQAIRRECRKLEEAFHSQEMAAGEVRHQRDGLVERFREDYGLNLEEEAKKDAGIGDQGSGVGEETNTTAEPPDAADGDSPSSITGSEATPDPESTPTPDLQSPTPVDRSAVDEEIEELRRKLRAIGSVNLDALRELDDLETRFATLSGQYQDLAKAKETLEQVIHKINADSRRLFAETLEAIRVHFQDLFRKLFGGGQGDIVLEEGGDILECGIDIVARPPGKELRNISLMSGGEKTMTCVALLMAIFRNRPSPFCVLDEVDAALDEANIARYTAVLKEFLSLTQFIVVTHSKKTMTCASTLYGVTMQESGISKRVSVRFEDVTEDGHITSAQPEEPPAAPRASPEAAA